MKLRRVEAGRLLACVAVLLVLGCLAGPLLAESTKSTSTIAAGTPFATPCYIQDSQVSGPTVMIVGGVHGDEPAGAAAAEQIRHWPIRRGRLVVIPRANPPALAAKTRLIPGVAKDQGNLNRNFPKAGHPDAPCGEGAAAIWQCVRQCKPDWLLDLHEGGGFRKQSPTSVGSSLIAFRSTEADQAAAAMLEAVNASIGDQSRQFVKLRTPVNGGLARAAGEHLNARAMILETTTAGQPLSRRARQHRLMVHRLLTYLEMIDPALSVDQLADVERRPGEIRVALYDAGGTSGQGVPRMEVILAAQAGTSIVRVGPDEFANHSLDQFDLVVFAGGSGSKEAEALGPKGAAGVRTFVEQGGGYIGICAGAYLATGGFPWGLKILDAKTASPQWRRGVGTVKFELTEVGRRMLGDYPGQREIRYANGPILAPLQSPALPDYEVLAEFRSELAENGTPPGIMRNSPAMVAGRFGMGRVFCSSPHPEQTKGLEDLVRRAVRWASASRTSPGAENSF